MRQACDDHRFVGLDAIPDTERELMHGRTTMLARALDDLILEGILTNAGQGRADLLDKAVAESRFTRFVVVLGGGDVPFCEGSDANRAAQGAG